MSLAKCLKKLKIDSSHEDSIISGLASLTEQGNLEGYRKATLALDQAMNDTLDEQEDIHIQLEKQGYSFKEDNSVKDSKLLEEKLNKQGYTFTITPKSVRDFVAKDKTREAQATTATNLASKFGKRITWIDAKGDFGINGVVVPNIKDVIFLDVNTKYPAHAVMGHELSHHLEYDKPDVYRELVKSMEGLLKNHKEYADKYKIEGASHKDIVKEMIGDIMGDNFTKQDFWNKLADQDRSLFTKIADTIKAWLEQFIKSDNLGSDAFVKDVKKAREVIALAVAKYKDVQQPTQSSEAKFHKVWQGSPHDHNKFDSTKIGTGEGAQAYGYGHYFAESKDVAEFYKKTLSNDDNYTTSDGTVWSPNTLKNLNARVKVRDALRKNTDLTKPIAQVQEMLDRNESEKMREMLRIDLSNLHDIQERGGLKNTLGKLYEVELAPKQDEYLLWDKPLSEQSDKVKRLLQNELRKHITIRSTQNNFTDVMYDGEELGYHKVPNVVNHIPFSGEDLYKGYTEKQGSDKKASDYLHSLGIRGIKYLDGSSRDKGEGAYNYVIFDDNDVSITAKFSRAIPYTAKEPIASNVSLEDLKAHPKYQEAKHGNLDSAISLVNDLISKEDVIKANSAFGKDVIYVPVTQFEKDGINRIPYAIAQKYASETGASINDSLYVKDKAFHTGMKMMERLIARTRFEGDITKGKYVLVDDVTSSGATLADLSSYIQEQGGDVVGSVLLTNAMRGDKLIADKSLTKLLETKYGNEIRELFGIEPSSLTREEAKYLQGFRTPDELRASANKASSSRAERIRIKALPKSEDAKFSKVATENTLIAQHNLTVKNLLHSDRMGGLAAPSIAITDKTFPLQGFGEITLLADKDLVDPKQGAKAYGSDIYSPRYPQLSYDFSGKAIERLNTLLSEGIEKTGDREFYNDGLENEPFKELTHSSAAMYQFLKAEGKSPELVFVQPKKLPSDSFKIFSEGKLDSFDLSRNNEFKKLVQEDFSKISEGDKLEGEELIRLARSYANDVISYRDAKKNVGKVDRQATNSALFRQITGSGLRNKFDEYLVSIVDRSGPKERIFQGYTNSGNRRYIPHDIDNVIKILKKDLRGGENFKYGLGSVRAKYSPQFKSIEQIRSSKDRLISSDAFKEVKAEVQAGLDDLNKSLESYGTFSGFDNVESMLSDSAKMGISAALKYNGFENVPDSIKIDIQEFINKLKSMPTEYFEAKVLRAVGLGEFSAAIIPKGAPKEVKEILTKNGITDIREYEDGNNQDRIEKINQVDKVMFSRVAPQDTIKINGIDRPTTNSEGKAIHPTQEGISNFWKWFGDDGNVDEQGRPKVLYHSTLEDVSEFNPVGRFMGYSGTSGISLTDNKEMASRYLDRYTEYGFVNDIANQPFSKNVMPVYAKIGKFIERNEPFKSDVRFGEPLPKSYVPAHVKLGYDTVIRDDSINRKGKGVKHSDAKNSLRGKEYIIANPNQIKSAIGNNGEYSLANNDIRFSKEAIPEETTYQKSQRTVQDKFNRFSVIRDWLKERGVKLTELSNVYDAEERYHAKVANQLEDFREKVRNPLVEKIAKAGFTLSDIQDFLLAQHASEANKQVQKVRNDSEALAYGITDEEASEYLSRAKPELVTLANELRDVTEQAKQLRLDAGILNNDITDNWDNTYKHYIPVKGDESIQGTGKGLNVKHKDKRRLGHEKRNEAVIENILMDYERAVMEVEKNRVGKYLVMFAAEANNPDLITVGQPEKRNILKENNSYAIVDSDGVIHSVYVNKIDAQRNAPKGSSIQKISDPRVIAQASPVLAPNEVNVYMDGHAIRVQLNDDLLARAYANMGVESVGAIVEAGRVLNSYLSKVYTGYNPEFIVTNIIRDFTSGIVNLTGEEGTLMAVKAIGNYPKMFADLFRYAVTRKSTELIDSYRANGGNTGAAYLSDMERLGKEISSEYASYQGVIANIKAGDGANAFRAAGRKVFNSTLKWIEHLNQAGENAMRLSAYKAMLDSGKTVEQASKVAKNITVNFNRRGEIGQTANALYLFFNASVQGSAAVLHANLRGNHKYQANALAVGMASLGYMLAAGLGGMDEEEYDKIDDTTKERNLIIGSGDSYVKIPIPYGYGFFFNTGRVIADAQRKGEFGKAPFRMAVNAVEELTPFGNLVNSDEINSEQVVGGVAPTALQIPYQMSTNTSLFTGKEIRPVSPFDNSQPEREQMFRNTKGTVYDDMAGLLSNAGFDVSPENIKFLTRTLTGGAGALVDTAVSSSKLKAQGAELDIKEMPFIRKFAGENTISNDRSAYYKAVEEAKKAAEEFSRARKNNDISSMKKVMEDKRELLAMDKYANKLRKVIKLSRDMQDSVRLNEEIPIAEKRLKLKELEAQESKLYDKYLDVYKARVK